MKGARFQGILTSSAHCPLDALHVHLDMAVSTSRREALRLYRDLLKSCKKFNWTNDDGLPWYELISPM